MRRYRAAGVAIVHKARADKSTRSQSSSTARCQAEGLSAVLDKLPIIPTEHPILYRQRYLIYVYESLGPEYPVCAEGTVEWRGVGRCL